MALGTLDDIEALPEELKRRIYPVSAGVHPTLGTTQPPAPAPSPEIQPQPPRDTLGTIAPTQTGPSFTDRLQNIELSQPAAPNPADYHTSTARKVLGTLASIPAGILGGVPAGEQTYSDVSNPALHKAEQQYGYDEGQYKQQLGTLQNEADFANKQQEASDKSALTQAQTGQAQANTATAQANADKVMVTLPDGRVAELPVKLAEDYIKSQNVIANKPPTAEQDKTWQAAAEQSLSQGTIGDADRTKLSGMQRAAKLAGIGPEIAAQVGRPPVPADYPKGENDPAYQKANQAWGQAAEKLKNQEAGASGAARGAGYNATRPVQVLVPQPDGSMASVYMTAAQAEAAGFSPSAQGTKAISQQAQFSDLNSAIEKVNSALDAVGNSAFTAPQVAKLTLAMKESDPTVMRNEISNLAASGLTPAQQDLITWLQQLQERALSLRNIAGMGQGSETTRDAILKALPDITSGNVEMAHKQLDALKNMVDNLHRGIPTVKGNEPNPSSPTPPKAGDVVDGFRFKGGNPGDQSNWEKVNAAR